MAPNHGGDPLGSILGSMGSHWVKEMGQNRKKWPCPKFELLRYPANILGPMGSHWVQKMGQNRKKLPCPKIRIFGYRFFAKNRSYGYCAKSRWGPPGSILGPMGSHWVQKIGQNRKKLPCPKIRIFGHRFFAKNRSYGYHAKSRRVHLGANGSKNWVKTVKNYHAAKCPIGWKKNGSKP